MPEETFKALAAHVPGGVSWQLRKALIVMLIGAIAPISNDCYCYSDDVRTDDAVCAMECVIRVLPHGHGPKLLPHPALPVRDMQAFWTQCQRPNSRIAEHSQGTGLECFPGLASRQPLMFSNNLYTLCLVASSCVIPLGACNQLMVHNHCCRGACGGRNATAMRQRTTWPLTSHVLQAAISAAVRWRGRRATGDQ